ncbi:hypothetical protein HQ520_02585 [bacterium]|nr:hypothetical protein [bacterium]
MTVEINPNSLYKREELVGLIGDKTFEGAQTKGGLYAVGGKYLGQDVLDCIRAAHLSRQV